MYHEPDCPPHRGVKAERREIETNRCRAIIDAGSA